jgi:hypothetical protein
VPQTGSTSGGTSALRAVWEAWRRFGRRLADVQARILLTVFYYVVLAPFALVLRWRTDPLGLRGQSPPAWRAREEPAGPPLVRARRQA